MLIILFFIKYVNCYKKLEFFSKCMLDEFCWLSREIIINFSISQNWKIYPGPSTVSHKLKRLYIMGAHGCSTCDQILVTSCTRIPMTSNLQPNFKTLGPHPLSCLILPCKPKANLTTYIIDIIFLVQKFCYQLNIEFCKFWKCIYAFFKV